MALHSGRDQSWTRMRCVQRSDTMLGAGRCFSRYCAIDRKDPRPPAHEGTGTRRSHKWGAVMLGISCRVRNGMFISAVVVSIVGRSRSLSRGCPRGLFPSSLPESIAPRFPRSCWSVLRSASEERRVRSAARSQSACGGGGQSGSHSSALSLLCCCAWHCSLPSLHRTP